MNNINLTNRLETVLLFNKIKIFRARTEISLLLKTLYSLTFLIRDLINPGNSHQSRMPKTNETSPPIPSFFMDTILTLCKNAT